MFDFFVRIIVSVIIVLVAFLLIWLIAFLIHIARDEIARENHQSYSPNLIDVIVNKISEFGLRLFTKIYDFLLHG